MGRYPDTPATKNSGDGPFTDNSANIYYQHYYSRLLAVATTRYRWEGLGDWVDPFRVEWMLVNFGIAAFTHVRPGDELGAGILERDAGRFTITRAAVTGYLDDTYTPAGYQTYGPNGSGGKHFKTTGEISTWKGVPIWGDSNRSSYDAVTIALFARRLASASLIVDVNLRSTTRGVVAVADQDKLLTTQTTLDSAMRGIDTIVAKPETLESLTTFDFGVHPDTVERSHVVAMRLWSEALEALGVESPAAEKKERMIVDEVNGDRSQISAVRRLTLAPRRRAAMLINRRYFEGESVVEVVDQW